jgi:hypothetical protein
VPSWRRRRGRGDRDRRRIGLPRRIVTILEGESLLNDATALVALRTALAATAGRGSSVWTVGSTSCGPPAAASLVGSRLRGGRLGAPAVDRHRLDTGISFVCRSRRTSRPSESTPPA